MGKEREVVLPYSSTGICQESVISNVISIKDRDSCSSTFALPKEPYFAVSTLLV